MDQYLVRQACSVVRTQSHLTLHLGPETLALLLPKSLHRHRLKVPSMAVRKTYTRDLRGHDSSVAVLLKVLLVAINNFRSPGLRLVPVHELTFFPHPVQYQQCQAPNEVLFGYMLSLDALSPLAQMPPEQASKVRELYNREAQDAIAFAAALLKVRYDSKNLPVYFRVGDKVLLRLQQGYKIAGQLNRKFSRQR